MAVVLGRWVLLAVVATVALPSHAYSADSSPGDPLVAARALEAEIVAAFAEGDPRRAAEIALRQLELRESAAPQPDLAIATSLSYLALAHRNLDEFSRAQRYARRALAITLELRGPDALDTATALNNLAGILRERGDALAAEHALRRALAIRTRSLPGDHPALAQSYNNLASLRLQQGDAASAEELYRAALDIVLETLGPGHDNALKARQNLARALAERGKVDAALGELDLVERELRRADPVVASRLADVVAQRAAIDFDHGRDEAAETALFEAISLRESISTEPQVEVIAARIALARIRSRQGAFEAAKRLHDAAIASARGLVGEAHPLTLEARVAAADHALAREEPARAIALLEPATAAYDTARQRAAEGLRSATAVLSSPFDRLAVAYARTGAVEKAWEAAERGRGRLLDTPGDTPASDERSILARTRAGLDATTAAVGWVTIEEASGSHASFAWVVRRDGPVRWIELGSARERLEALRAAAIRPPDLFDPTDLDEIATLAHVAYQSIFAAIDAHLDGIERLVAVPTGALSSLPLSMLIDAQQRHLDARFTIEVTPSLRTWLDHATERSRPRRQRSVLALGDPPFRHDHAEPARTQPRPRAIVDLARLPRLTGTRAEAAATREHFARGEVLLGADASEARLRELARNDRLRDFDVVHLATHAIVDVERPGLSLLALSQLDLPETSRSLAFEGPLEDGALTVDEILAEWELDADLVTLSACNTAMGTPTQGDGLLGFAQAFLLVGARSLVLSLWEVDDDATALLMREFYSTLEREPGSVRPAQALRTAQRWLRSYTDGTGERPYAHPYFWAPFVAVSVR